MSYFGFNQAQTNKELAAAAENLIGSSSRSDADFFDGAFTAPFKGLYAGVTQADQVAWAGVDAVVSPIASAVNDTFGINDTSESFIKEQRRLAEQQVRALTPDRGTTGTAGQVLFSLAEIGGQAVAGSLVGGLPGAAATVGASQGFSDYEKSSADGVDYGTAVEKSLVTGGTSALGAVLPMSLGLRAGGIVAEGAGAALSSAGGRAGAIAAAGARAALICSTQPVPALPSAWRNVACLPKPFGVAGMMIWPGSMTSWMVTHWQQMQCWALPLVAWADSSIAAVKTSPRVLLLLMRYQQH